MKSKKVILFTVVIAFSFLLMQCTKEGPMGPPGADGLNGQDGNVVCLECHSAENADAVMALFMQSIHYQSVTQYNGQPTYIYAGEGENRKSCAPCHTHEGFVEVMFTGRDTLVEALVGPSHITCETCHSNHQSFDFETDGQDYALRLTEATTLLVGGDVVDLGGTSNACLFCHQPRRGWDSYDDGSYSHPDSVYISSSHAGPHHGPQAIVLIGKGGIADGDESGHIDLGCTGCHMGEAGTDIGGHSFWPNVANCTECHSDATDFDVNGSQTALHTKVESLKTKLQTAGVLDVDGHTVVGVYHRDVFQAWWNFMVVEEDKSMGVHNPGYCEALIDDAIALLP